MKPVPPVIRTLVIDRYWVTTFEAADFAPRPSVSGTGFFARNGPIASASRCPILNALTASCGVQTIGSSWMLKLVLMIDAMPAIVAEFVDRGLIRIRYVYFPLAALHENAVATAKAAHCAGAGGRFWSYHNYLYVRQPEWAGAVVPDSLWIAYAESLGLERQEFAGCLEAPETLAAVNLDLREALASGATGTPTIVFGGRSLVGFDSYEELRAEILSAIEDAQR